MAYSCVYHLFIVNFVWKLMIGDSPTERRYPETNGGGPKAKENTTGKAGKFALSIYMYSECKNDDIKLPS